MHAILMKCRNVSSFFSYFDINCSQILEELLNLGRDSAGPGIFVEGVSRNIQPNRIPGEIFRNFSE